MNFSEMLVKTRNIETNDGDSTGTCCICGETTSVGHPKKFGGNFTSADMVSTGDVICPSCKHLVDNSNSYRRTMFLLTEDTFKPFKKQEAKEIVFNLPNKPFYLYLTKTWQKIGWIKMNTVYNTGNIGDINVLIDYDRVTFRLDNLRKLCAFIKELRDLKISKFDLESGVFEMHNFKKLREAYNVREARRIVNKVKEYAGNPIWDLALYLEK